MCCWAAQLVGSSAPPDPEKLELLVDCIGALGVLSMEEEEEKVVAWRRRRRRRRRRKVYSKLTQ